MAQWARIQAGQSDDLGAIGDHQQEPPDVAISNSGASESSYRGIGGSFQGSHSRSTPRGRAHTVKLSHDRRLVVVDASRGDPPVRGCRPSRHGRP